MSSPLPNPSPRQRIQELVPLVLSESGFLRSLTRHVLEVAGDLAGVRPSKTSAESLEEVEARLPARGFASFAQSLRGYGHIQWNSIAPEQLHPETPQVALRCLTAHGNGRVREAAIRCLNEDPNNTRWLILAINDWYRPNAELAKTKLVNRIKEQTPLAWLPYLDLIQGFGRNSTEEVQNAITLACQDNPGSFEQYISDRSALPVARRSAWKTLYHLFPQRALSLARASGDVVLRSRSLRHADSVDEWRTYLTDPAASLRRESLMKLYSADALADDILADALLDRVHSVRDLAKFFAKKSDRLELLRSTYENAPISVGKLEGAVGVVSDGELKPLLLESLLHPTVSIQKAAMNALDRVLTEAEEFWWDMLRTDTSPWKRRMAGKLLCQRRSFYVIGDPLWERLEQATSPLKEELQALAERSPSPFLRLKAHYHSVLSDRQRWNRDGFQDRLRAISRELPPYRLSLERQAEIDHIVSQYGDEQKERLGI